MCLKAAVAFIYLLLFSICPVQKTLDFIFLKVLLSPYGSPWTVEITG